MTIHSIVKYLSQIVWFTVNTRGCQRRTVNSDYTVNFQVTPTYDMVYGKLMAGLSINIHVTMNLVLRFFRPTVCVPKKV